MIGRTVLHYKILSPLGSGGMGVVYLAEDERLGRQVALKFLPASWSQEREALERFRIEARTAGALSHPSICTIYDIGSDGDAPFIVMEALKGETLRERIAKGTLSLTEILEIAIQLTDALDAAHARGIVHRDVKPANIFIGERNRVKVLDFGLAKLGAVPSARSTLTDTTSIAMHRTHDAHMTTPGTAVGTVSYMSPEQARGEEVDTRTDLFSIGAVIYEMATGVRAFGGTSAAVAFDAILNRTPQPISSLNPQASQLEAIVEKALEKDRELRYQHASDMHAELKRIRRYLDAASFVDVQPKTAGPGLQPAATATRSRAMMTGAAVVALAAIAIAVWVWRGPNGSRDRSGPPPRVAEASISGEAPTDVPAVAADTALREARALAPGDAAKPVGTRPVPAETASGQPVRGVGVTREEPRSASTSVGVAEIPPRSTASPIVNTPAIQAPAIPNVLATDPPASASTAPEKAPGPDPTVQPAATVASAADNRSDGTLQTPASGAQKPAATAAPSAEAPVGQTDDEAAIRRVLRTYEQAIETKDLALYRSIRSGLTPAEETLLRNSFRQVDSQEVTIRVESLSVAGRAATARISRQDTLVTRGRRQTQTSTQTLRFEKTSAGWVIVD